MTLIKTLRGLVDRHWLRAIRQNFSYLNLNKINFSPRPWHLIVGFFPWFISGALKVGLTHQWKRLLGPGFLKPFSYPPDSDLSTSKGLPKLDALLVVAGKDFEVLPRTIENLQAGSINRIKAITIITPKVDLDRCKDLVSTLQTLLGVPLEVLDEDAILTADFRTALKERFGSKYGWVLQQLLTTEWVFRSNAEGILVVDADTILLQPRIWLDSQGNQPLLVSAEYHASYYAFLSKIGISKDPPVNTHVTHHMLMQPRKLREILTLAGIKNVEDLGQRAIAANHLDQGSPVCLEYEVYAQGLINFFPDSCRLAKFSNIGVELVSMESAAGTIEKFRNEANYSSISFHTYLQPNKA